VSAGRTTWLIAAETAPWRAPLTAQLAAHGMAVEPVGTPQADAWRSAGAMPEVRGLPQLLVLPMEVARVDDWALLRLLERAPVWRCVPRVVVGHPDDPDAVSTCHALGVANVVELPPDAAPASVEQFARYWARTALLPAAEYLLG
jgi:hypothetical protein